MNLNVLISNFCVVFLFFWIFFDLVIDLNILNKKLFGLEKFRFFLLVLKMFVKNLFKLNLNLFLEILLNSFFKILFEVVWMFFWLINELEILLNNLVNFFLEILFVIFGSLDICEYNILLINFNDFLFWVSDLISDEIFWIIVELLFELEN